MLFDLTLIGGVTEEGAAAVGAEVWLEERNWSPGMVHGQGQTDASGAYQLDATALPIVEGCWGWATGFFLVARLGEATAELPLNSKIISAWLDGATEAEVEVLQLKPEAR
ncbi:MAG TPA: hypothetical protein ENK18_20725 [Deltaproteobacteria bacterium]|nr:hypothetical protein [Deltaproteobacteria bacterium]